MITEPIRTLLLIAIYLLVLVLIMLIVPEIDDDNEGDE